MLGCFYAGEVDEFGWRRMAGSSGVRGRRPGGEDDDGDDDSDGDDDDEDDDDDDDDIADQVNKIYEFMT